MSNCPICSGLILRHISANKVYWYCTSCHQKVPNLTSRPLVKLAQEDFHKQLNPTLKDLIYA